MDEASPRAPALKVTRRIVRKLRLQRLPADRELDAMMESDPGRFRELFGRCDAEVQPKSTFAEDEVRAFRAFVAGRDTSSIGRLPLAPAERAWCAFSMCGTALLMMINVVCDSV